MTVWKVYPHLVRQSMAPTLEILYRDGVLYFVAIFIVAVVRSSCVTLNALLSSKRERSCKVITESAKHAVFMTDGTCAYMYYCRFCRTRFSVLDCSGCPDPIQCTGIDLVHPISNNFFSCRGHRWLVLLISGFSE